MSVQFCKGSTNKTDLPEVVSNYTLGWMRAVCGQSIKVTQDSRFESEERLSLISRIALGVLFVACLPISLPLTLVGWMVLCCSTTYTSTMQAYEKALKPAVVLPKVEEKPKESLYINTETLGLAEIDLIPKAKLFVTSDNYAFNIDELIDSLITSFKGDYRNPYTRNKLTEDDIKQLKAFHKTKDLDVFLQNINSDSHRVTEATLQDIEKFVGLSMEAVGKPIKEKKALNFFKATLDKLGEQEKKALNEHLIIKENERQYFKDIFQYIQDGNACLEHTKDDLYLGFKEIRKLRMEKLKLEKDNKNIVVTSNDQYFDINELVDTIVKNYNGKFYNFYDEESFGEDDIKRIKAFPKAKEIELYLSNRNVNSHKIPVGIIEEIRVLGNKFKTIENTKSVNDAKQHFLQELEKLAKEEKDVLFQHVYRGSPFKEIVEDIEDLDTKYYSHTEIKSLGRLLAACRQEMILVVAKHNEDH